MAKKEKLEDVLNLAQGQIDAVTDTEIEALNAAQEQANIDMLEREYLQEAQTAEADALRTYNDAQYANLSQINSKIEETINNAKQKDETARRREKAFRYISGLGDTLSSIANLVGTAHGAANQNQTYNSYDVVQKAEAARKARKLEMDDLSKRLDEMTARQRELKASGSLKEAELKANQAREMAKLVAAQREKADAMKVAADEKTYRAMRDARKDWEADIKANKPTTEKPSIIKVMGDNGEMLDFDVSGFKNFDADYQRALAAAIADGTSGLSADELDRYEKATKLATVEGDRALKEFFRTHTPKQSIIKRMGINNPRYK